MKAIHISSSGRFRYHAGYRGTETHRFLGLGTIERPEWILPIPNPDPPLDLKAKSLKTGNSASRSRSSSFIPMGVWRGTAFVLEVRLCGLVGL
jgi:hypothetical protein